MAQTKCRSTPYSEVGDGTSMLTTVRLIPVKRVVADVTIEIHQKLFLDPDMVMTIEWIKIQRSGIIASKLRTQLGHFVGCLTHQSLRSYLMIRR